MLDDGEVDEGDYFEEEHPNLNEMEDDKVRSHCCCRRRYTF